MTFNKGNKSDRQSVHFFTRLLYCILYCTVPNSKTALQYDIADENERRCSSFVISMAISGYHPREHVRMRRKSLLDNGTLLQTTPKFISTQTLAMRLIDHLLLMLTINFDECASTVFHVSRHIHIRDDITLIEKEK